MKKCPSERLHDLLDLMLEEIPPRADKVLKKAQVMLDSILFGEIAADIFIKESKKKKAN